MHAVVSPKNVYENPCLVCFGHRGGSGSEMFLEKLWLRIKGELIVFREDLGASQDIKEKAERLLQKLEDQLASMTGRQKQEGERPDASPGESLEKEPQAAESLREIEQEWQELLKLREEQKEKDSSHQTTPRNPRTLG